jgi:hypothetical protein
MAREAVKISVTAQFYTVQVVEKSYRCHDLFRYFHSFSRHGPHSAAVTRLASARFFSPWCALASRMRTRGFEAESRGPKPQVRATLPLKSHTLMRNVHAEVESKIAIFLNRIGVKRIAEWLYTRAMTIR